MTASEALDQLDTLAQTESARACVLSSIVRAALAATDAELDAYRTQVAIAFGYDGPLGPAMFSIVEAVAAKDAEIAAADEALKLNQDEFARHMVQWNEMRAQVAALAEERDRTARAFATMASKLTFDVGEKMALATAHAALRKFVDDTVRGWLADLVGDEHANCDASCKHRAACDEMYEALDAALADAPGPQ